MSESSAGPGWYRTVVAGAVCGVVLLIGSPVPVGASAPPGQVVPVASSAASPERVAVGPDARPRSMTRRHFASRWLHRVERARWGWIRRHSRMRVEGYLGVSIRELRWYRRTYGDLPGAYRVNRCIRDMYPHKPALLWCDVGAGAEMVVKQTGRSSFRVMTFRGDD